MTGPRLLILGKGEVARSLAHIACAADYAISVCEAALDAADWPDGTELIDRIYTDAPWSLPEHTHAVVARGHEADPASVASLLNHGAAHVYLIASARRSVAVIEQAEHISATPLALERLSAPAGLDLGGRESAEIALSILAEIQWRRHGGTRLPLKERVAEKLAQPPGITDDSQCPGKRP